jgi:hypothetical protein
VAEVDLESTPGRLTVVGASDSDHVRLTGQLTWSGQAPTAVTRFDKATRVLTVSYVCAAASPCSGDLVLAVPGNTATALSLRSGLVTVTDVAGPLRITASHVKVTAAGLRSPVLVAEITSGQMTAAFAAPPARVGITLTSAQAILRLPASTTYRVIGQVVSGQLRVTVPRSASATRVVAASIAGGELDVVSS